MIKRIAFIGILLLSLGGITFKARLFRFVVDSNAFLQVHIGMTELEVEDLLGRPADEYRELTFTGPRNEARTLSAYWYGSDSIIQVAFWQHTVQSTTTLPAHGQLDPAPYWSFGRKLWRHLRFIAL